MLGKYGKRVRPLRWIVWMVVLASWACAPKRVVTPRPAGSDPDFAPAPEVAIPAPEHAPAAGSRSRETTSGRPVADQKNLGSRAAALAKDQLGKPYQWGAAGPDRFDCSGLVQHVYGSLGVDLPRVSRDQARAGRGVDGDDLRPGDLVFFVTAGNTINHVGIYVGGNRFVHAPRRHTPVRTDSLNDSWWRRRFRTARRVP